LEEWSKQSLFSLTRLQAHNLHKDKTYSGYFAKLVGFGVEVYSWPCLHSGGRGISIASTATPYDPYFKYQHQNIHACFKCA